MRLLAYGGNQLRLRRQEGTWAEIPVGALEDTVGIESLPAWGFGVLSSEPHLVFREIQQKERRGGYPFTLLVDPGEDVWKEAGWDALLLCRRLEAWEGLEQLRLGPETTDFEQLREQLRNGKVPEAGAGSSEFAASWLAALATGTASPEPSSAVALPGDPSLLTLAGALAALPLAFRNGWGWLAGSNPVNARNLGCGIHVASGGDGASEEARALLHAIELASVDLGAPLAALLDLPFWRWTLEASDIFGLVQAIAAPRATEATLGLLHAFSSDERASSDLRAQVSSALERQLDFSAADPAVTRWILREAKRGRRRERLDPALDSHALAEFLANIREDPASSPIVRPSPSAALECYRELFDVLPSREIVQYAIAATAAPAFTAIAPDVAELAVKRTSALDGNLGAWLGTPALPIEAVALRAALERATRRRLSEGKATAAEYLALGGDASGELLWSSAGTHAADMVALVLAESERAGPATDWLRGIATHAPLRSALPLELKLDVARAVRGPWESLLAVEATLTGGDRPPEKLEISDGERELLTGEAVALIERASRFDFAPSLLRLRALVDLRQPALVGQLARYRPSPDDVASLDLIRFLHDEGSDATVREPFLHAVRSAGETRLTELARICFTSGLAFDACIELEGRDPRYLEPFVTGLGIETRREIAPKLIAKLRPATLARCLSAVEALLEARPDAGPQTATMLLSDRGETRIACFHLFLAALFADSSSECRLLGELSAFLRDQPAGSEPPESMLGWLWPAGVARSAPEQLCWNWPDLPRRHGRGWSLLSATPSFLTRPILRLMRLTYPTGFLILAVRTLKHHAPTRLAANVRRELDVAGATGFRSIVRLLLEGRSAAAVRKETE